MAQIVLGLPSMVLFVNDFSLLKLICLYKGHAILSEVTRSKKGQ